MIGFQVMSSFIQVVISQNELQLLSRAEKWITLTLSRLGEGPMALLRVLAKYLKNSLADLHQALWLQDTYIGDLLKLKGCW